MNKDHFKKEDTVLLISNQIWECANILKYYSINQRLDVILFLITIINRNWRFLVTIEDDKSRSRIDFKIGDEETPLLLQLTHEYKSILENLPYSGLQDVFSSIDGVDKEELNNHFFEIFENLLQRIINLKGKKASESILPNEVSNLIIELADLKNNSTIYNPFAGFASFGLYLKNDQTYYGQELNPTTWAIGQMRMMAKYKNTSYKYEVNNSIENWDDFEKFDLVIANPPFKIPVPRYLRSNMTGDSYGTVESFLIDKGIHTLKRNGQLIAIFSLSFLFSRGREARLKKHLIDKGLIDTIITLPSGLLSNTNIPICIVIIKNTSPRPGYIRLVDGTSFFKKTGTRSKILNNIELFEHINQNSENEFLKYVSNEEVYKNEFDLSVSRYFLKKISGTKLKTFAAIIKAKKALINTKMKQVQIRNLKEDVFDSILKSNEVEASLIKRETFRVIEESCLLIATRWNTLKPTYFEFTGEPIVISRAIVALKINEDQVDPIYLINEFSADYIKEQLYSYRVGTVQPILRNKDLENIVFKLSSIEEQRAKVSGIIELSERLKEIESEKARLVGGIKREETESSTSLSHILGKPLLSIGSSLEIIQGTLSKLDPNWKKFIISQKRQFTLADAFDAISKNVKYIQELADENTSLVSVSNFELSDLFFLKFLIDFVKVERKSLKNNITLNLDVHEDVKEQMDNQVLIKGNDQKLRIVLINLLDNAKNHAFILGEQSNKINIEILPFLGNENEASSLNYEIDSRKSYIEIKVSNTGVSFPKDFMLKDYTRKNFAAGKTGNRGLGGYEVNEILKAHNGGRDALNIVSNKEDSEYSTTISFVIPII